MRDFAQDPFRHFDIECGDPPVLSDFKIVKGLLEPEGVIATRFNSPKVRLEELISSTNQLMNDDGKKAREFLSSAIKAHGNMTPMQMAQSGFSGYEKAMRLLHARLVR